MQNRIEDIRLIYENGKKNYASAIENTRINKFDVVIVDGEYRHECVKTALPYIRSGGLLVVDNTDWHWFEKCLPEEIPSRWRKRIFSGYAPMLGHKSQTTVWYKPN